MFTMYIPAYTHAQTVWMVCQSGIVKRSMRDFFGFSAATEPLACWVLRFSAGACVDEGMTWLAGGL